MTLDPNAFAADWLAAWNAHDVEGVLRHFHEDAVFASPFAAQVMPETGGRLVGKAAIRAYWTLGLSRIPDLRFTLTELFVGVDMLVIAYVNQKGVRVSEVLKLDGGLVVEGWGTYPPEVANPTGANT
ncbi:MAG: nuclear transport factor 2 family protein [Caulobacter sp.]|nr:nuclear transport factor 2 family protein [Caulobacter sp.]